MKKSPLVRTTAYLTLSVVIIIMVYPFIWMFFSTFKSNPEIYRPTQLLPEAFTTQYYDELMSWNAAEVVALRDQAIQLRRKAEQTLESSALIRKADELEEHARVLSRTDYFPFKTVFINSLLIAFFQAVFAVVLAATCAYVLARFAFKGKNILIALVILVILVPKQLLAVPTLGWFAWLGLTDSMFGLILSGMLSGIGVIYFIQIFKQLPEDLSDTARLEGAGELRIFLIHLPLVKSALLTFGLLHFMLAWHDHLLPLLLLQSQDNLTLPLALNQLLGSSMRYPRAVLLAGALFTIIPVALLFAVLYRHIRSGLRDFVQH
ncbi:carbohydrate ABC transporter permease [bacterium AH-315-E10]|nr:carbohydrate ABC transporter permease [bacterium AH-315-E10]